MEVNSDTMNSEVDVNILINHYHKKLSTLVNQNILLEAKNGIHDKRLYGFKAKI